MLKSSIFAALILIGLCTLTARAQSKVDPGISTHNYKHPNKAAQAKAFEEGKSIRVATIKTVQDYYKRQNRMANSTPKYAPRPASLVITRTLERERSDLNPLLSPRNYKTPNSYQHKRTFEVADYKILADSASYPSVD